MRTIQYSLLVTTFAALVYGVALNYVPDYGPDEAIGSSQRSLNRIRGEAFTCLAATPDVVLVGSSLTGILTTLPPTWFNLAQTGGTLLTGLKLVERSGVRPRFVLIETNLIGSERAADTELITSLLDGPFARLRCRLRLLQHRFRPVELLLTTLMERRRSARGTTTSGVRYVPATTEEHLRRKDELKTRSETYARLPARAALEREAKIVRATCDRLALEGTRCVAFEMPIESELEPLPWPTAVRSYVQKTLPPPTFPWAPRVATGSIRTTDGVHVDPWSAACVARTLVDWMNAGRPEEDADHESRPRCAE